MITWSAPLPSSQAVLTIALPNEPTPDDVRKALTGLDILNVAVTHDLIAVTIRPNHYLEFTRE